MRASDRVLVSVPGRWAGVLVAGGARMGSPHQGWGPVLRVDQGGSLITVDLHAAGFRQLICELRTVRAPDGPKLYAAMAGDWQVVDLAGRSPHEIIETLCDRLRAAQTAGRS